MNTRQLELARQHAIFDLFGDTPIVISPAKTNHRRFTVYLPSGKQQMYLVVLGETYEPNKCISAALIETSLGVATVYRIR